MGKTEACLALETSAIVRVRGGGGEAARRVRDGNDVLQASYERRDGGAQSSALWGPVRRVRRTGLLRALE